MRIHETRHAAPRRPRKDRVDHFAEIPTALPLSKQVEQRIRKAIVEGRLKPNVLYTETSLAQQLGISRTPVREAVLELSSRGFVTVLPRRGFMVRIFSDDALREVYDLRWALESHTVRTLCADPSRYDFSLLEQAARSQRESGARDEIGGAVSHGRTFHDELLRLAGNSMISAVYREINDVINVVWTQAFTHSISAVDVAGEHIILVDLIRKGDADAACALLREHLVRSEKAVLAARPANEG